MMMIVMRWNGMSLGGRKEGVDVRNTWRNGRSLLPPAAFCRTTAEKLEVFLVDVFETANGWVTNQIISSECKYTNKNRYHQNGH